MSLDSFARRIEARSDEIVVRAGRAVGEVAGVIFDEVVRATPADTGKARSNWRVSVNGSGGSQVRPPFSPGKNLGIEETANAQAASSAARARLASVKSSDTVDISNPLDYIAQLNNGSSRQAPANFVQLAVLAGVAEAGRQRLLRD